MKTSTALSALAPLLFCAISAFGQGAPDCAWTDNFGAATAGTTHSSTSAGNSPCVAYRVTYEASGMTGLSLQLEGAPCDSSPDCTGPGTFTPISGTAIVQGANPMTDPNNATLATTGTVYYPFMRINVTTFTPTGSSGLIVVRTYGYKGTSAAVPSHGGGGGSIADTLDLLAGDGAGNAIDSTIPYTAQPQGYAVLIGLKPTVPNTQTDVWCFGGGDDSGASCDGNMGTEVVASGDGAAFGNTGSEVVASGDSAAFGNTGSEVVASGDSAAFGNTGSEVVANGESAANGNMGTEVVASGEAAAFGNTGSEVVANGDSAAFGNTGSEVVANGEDAAFGNSGNWVNANGLGAAYNNTGSYVIANGTVAAASNSGSYVVAIGTIAANANTGSYVVASGYGAATDNSFNNVLAFTNEQIDPVSYSWQPTQNNDIELGDPSFSLTHLYGNVSTYGGSFSVPQLPTPNAPTVTPTCASACSSTWGYEIVAVLADGTTTTNASAETQTTAQNATLDSSDFNLVTCTEVPGASFYQVFRTTVATSPSTTGIIGTLAYLSCSTGLVDNGLPGDGSPAPSINSTGRFGPMLGPGDMIAGALSSGGAAARVAANTNPTVVKVLTQTNSEIPVWGSLIQTGQQYYFTDTASDIASTLQATTGTYSPKTTLGPYSLINGTKTIQQFATNAGNPGVTSIPAGEYEIHIHYSRSPAPISSITLQAVIEEVDATGAFIATIGTTEQTPIINPQGGEQEAFLDFADSNPYVMASANSRIMVLIQAICGSNVPTVNLYVGGTADAHLALPGSVGVNGVSLIAKGSQDLSGVGSVTAGTCSSALITSATGVLTTDTITPTFNGDPTGIVGFQPGAMLAVIPYPSADSVNFKVCNNTASNLAPGSIGVNWQVVR